MATETYTDPVLLTGDMIATLTGQPTNQGNPGDANFGIIMPNATALATPDDLYRLVWYQNINTSATEFGNGQFWRLEIYTAATDTDTDPANGDAGWTAVPGFDTLNPKFDLVSGLGAGDNYIVLEGPGGYLLYNHDGGLPTTPTTLVYEQTIENGDPLVGDEDGNLDFYDMYAAYEALVPCFAKGTTIATDTGNVAIEDLGVGMLVETRDNGLQEIQWIGNRTLNAADLEKSPNLKPIRIRAGALGPDLPARDLVVSPQHRIVVRSNIVLRMFDVAEVLVAAKHLVNIPGIEVAEDLTEVTYYHMLFERHEIVLSNGAETESLHPGKESLKAVGGAARDEIFTLFPALRFYGKANPPPGAAPFVKGRQGRALAHRHAKNDKQLVARIA
ncbi:Hint domain-containing protein [Celeribacter arenosi]|uniref:Hedgehog/Intein (Hint) domain-containing protein n=1 Tax=Celeribacter arenosi TaxID=792649 RepID=A0ABP7K6U0_9RHOB